MIQKIGENDIEQFTLTVTPRRSFSSSSITGEVSGTVNLFAQRSNIEKEVQSLSPFMINEFNDSKDIQPINSSSTNIFAKMETYLANVNSKSTTERKQKTLNVIRFEPSVRFTSDTMRKNVVQKTLFPYYRSTYPTAHWAYTNYHTLNFFTSSDVPSDTVLLYPNSSSDVNPSSISGTYALAKGFTFEFYINPRYTTDAQGDEFHAGTIFHLSSSYAISLVTGTLNDETEKPTGFRLVLQLSHSADFAPSTVNLLSPNNGQNRDLIFISDDNSLRKNHWNHVAIRWGTDEINEGTGSFIIDGELAGEFIIPSSTIAPAPFQNSGNPDVLCIGNFYEGSNSGLNSQAIFFNQNIAIREGLLELYNDGQDTTFTPTNFTFAHPLNAEIHELKIHSKYLNLDEINSLRINGPKTLENIRFYVPPFFVKESPKRKTYLQDSDGISQGGILQTPFFSITGSTEDPFNVALSFGVGGRLINLENFTRDLSTGFYPRLLHLSASEVSRTTQELKSANEFLYATGSIRKRNATILPCDNGKFLPEFGILVSGVMNNNPESGSTCDRFSNDLNNLDLSIISLTNMISTGALFNGLIFDSGTFFEGLAGATPEDPGIAPGSVLTIYQRTRDNSSNEVVFFDISNMFYGRRINPGTFEITDNAITGTGGKISITLKDDGHGNLYRADALTPHSKWSSVGNIFYNEGIAVVKNPNIPFFGKEQFETTFQGEQNIHLMRIHVLARSGEINSSSNPTFGLDWTTSPPMPRNIVMSSSNLAHETDDNFAYITGLNFHDENLNVILKTKFAQPIIKKNSDKFLFRVKMDF